MLPDRWKSFERTKLYDLAAALPLVAFYGWTVWDLWPQLVRSYYIHRYGFVDTAIVVQSAAQLLSVVFAGLLVVLLLVRTVPKAKSGQILPRIVAVLGTFAGIAILRLPAAAPPLWLSTISVGLILGGTLATIIALGWLGRSFSIMPEARTLVTTGPYSLIRHPVYLFEEITLFGIMLQYAQPWALLLFAAQLTLQLTRMHYEEKVLTAAFPEYRLYASRTARLLPGLY